MKQELSHVNTDINTHWRFSFVDIVNQDPHQSLSNKNMLRCTEAKLELPFNENSNKKIFKETTRPVPSARGEHLPCLGCLYHLLGVTKAYVPDSGARTTGAVFSIPTGLMDLCMSTLLSSFLFLASQ